MSDHGIKSLTPQQAWQMLQDDPRALLVDIRSTMEYLFVGHPTGAVHVAWIDEPALGRIRLGQEAEVVTDDGQTRTGHLSVISPRAEFTPKNVQTRDERVKLVYEIEIALDNDDGLFKPGMPAEALLKTSAP